MRRTELVLGGCVLALALGAGEAWCSAIIGGNLPGGRAGKAGAARAARQRAKGASGLHPTADLERGKDHPVGLVEHKWELPNAPEIERLDTSAFDAAAADLALTDVQNGRLDTVRKRLLEETDRLQKAQTDARGAYQRAADDAAAYAAAKTVVQADADVRSFRPNAVWRLELAVVLNSDQATTLRNRTDQAEKK